MGFVTKLFCCLLAIMAVNELVGGAPNAGIENDDRQQWSPMMSNPWGDAKEDLRFAVTLGSSIDVDQPLQFASEIIPSSGIIPGPESKFRIPSRGVYQYSFNIRVKQRCQFALRLIRKMWGPCISGSNPSTGSDGSISSSCLQPEVQTVNVASAIADSEGDTNIYDSTVTNSGILFFEKDDEVQLYLQHVYDDAHASGPGTPPCNIDERFSTLQMNNLYQLEKDDETVVDPSSSASNSCYPYC
jgi:hypothetical protein